MAMSTVAGAVIPLVIREVLERVLPKEQATKAIVAMESDPKVINEVSAEAPWQSRIAVGSTVGALGVLIPLVARAFGADISESTVVEATQAIIVLAGTGYALYGRFRRGLKPLFS